MILIGRVTHVSADRFTKASGTVVNTIVPWMTKSTLFQIATILLILLQLLNIVAHTDNVFLGVHTVHTDVFLPGLRVDNPERQDRTFTTPPPLTLTTRTTITAPPPRTTTPKPGRRCFPSIARVNLTNGKSVTMSELQIGDHVLVGKKIF